jgi:hypothetical protein
MRERRQSIVLDQAESCLHVLEGLPAFLLGE